jgi:hypothetical protein
MTSPQTVQSESAHMNGVDVAGVFATIQAIKADAGLAKFQFRASNRWIDGGHNRSTIQGFYGCRMEDESRSAPFVLDADEPPVLLGRDSGANPVEFISTGSPPA